MPIDPKMARSQGYRSDCSVEIVEASINNTAPHEIVLRIQPPPRLPLLIDSITVLDLITADGESLGEVRSPRFIHGIHTAMELKVPHMQPFFPFYTTLAGLHATVECCTGCNGGIHDRDLVVVNNHSGGGWSGMWVRTAKVIEGPYPRWQRVMFAGGILSDEDGALTLVDQGWMLVRKGNEQPHHAPPPLPIHTSDIPEGMTQSLLTKSLDGTWVELQHVKVVSVRNVVPETTPFSRSLARIEMRVDDGSGIANAYMYQSSAAKINIGQTVKMLRGFVHAEKPGVYALLSDKEEDLVL
jgi:hypothetical protein